MRLPDQRGPRRHTGGPNRTPGKAALIAGTVYRHCDTCGNRVFVPVFSEWKTCTPCRRGWSTPVEDSPPAGRRRLQ